MLRKGMWVVYDGKVGIFTASRVETHEGSIMRPEFHATDDDGDTILVIPDPETALMRQCALADIPAPRRPDAAFGASLGYV